MLAFFPRSIFLPSCPSEPCVLRVDAWLWHLHATAGRPKARAPLFVLLVSPRNLIPKLPPRAARLTLSLSSLSSLSSSSGHHRRRRRRRRLWPRRRPHRQLAFRILPGASRTQFGQSQSPTGSLVIPMQPQWNHWNGQSALSHATMSPYDTCLPSRPGQHCGT